MALTDQRGLVAWVAQ
ncbi:MULTISPECIES: hypothetical protein [unclassified Delftia]